ncbi:MAG: lipoprotein [Moraxellaceae bacterium]
MSRLLLLSLACLLAACGQKGPLFLPVTPVAPTPGAAPVTAPVPATTGQAATGQEATVKKEKTESATAPRP